MINITIQFGSTTITREVSNGTTVADIKANEALGDVLGADLDSCNASKAGIALADSYVLQSGDVVKFQTASNDKGSL